MSTRNSQVELDGRPLSSSSLAAWVDRLASVDTAAADGELIDQITQLERMKSACAAAQAELTLAFVASQASGLSTVQARDERAHRSTASQVAMARHDSPFRGGRHVGLAKALVREMPHAFAALRAGEISERRATLLVRETACLSAADRSAVDRELAGRLFGLGDRQTAQAAARIAQRLDPESCVERNRRAIGERRVSIRPAPDTMAYLSALLPVAQAVAVYAALTRHATAAKATGDSRSRGQLMADEMVHRVTAPAAGSPAGGHAGAASSTKSDGDDSPAAEGTGCGRGAASDGDGSPAGEGTGRGGNPATPTNPATSIDGDPVHGNDGVYGNDGVHGNSGVQLNSGVRGSGAEGNGAEVSGTEVNGTEVNGGNSPGPGCVPPGVGLDIQLVMTDRTLFDGDDEPATLTGYGPIPAALARHLVRSAGPEIKAWIRRLFTGPRSGHLITADSQRRTFSHSARQFLIARDQICRTPWCDAPIRHADRVTSHVDGGATQVGNGQGQCERCNYTKEAPGWSSRVDPDGIGIVITTPTGHTIRSDPPLPPRSKPWAEEQSPLEARLRRLLAAA